MRGTIRKVPGKRGVSYEVRLDYPRGPDGRRRQACRRYKGRREAEDALAHMLAEARDGVPIATERLTVNQYLDQYLEAVRGTVRESTLRGKRRMLSYWRPLLGAAPLAKLRPMDVQRAVGALPERLAMATRTEAFRVLRTALRQAVRWGMLARDPTDGVRPPKGPVREMRVWSRDEAAAFLRSAKGRRLYPLFALALATGMREGELLALRWDDVDLAAREVSVLHTLHYPDAGPWSLAELKTRSSRRKVAVSREVADMLRAWRRRQNAERLAAGPAWEDDGLVFCGPRGRPLRPSDAIHAFHRAAKAAGLPRIRFHDLRHTHATDLLARGVPAPEVAARLGHSNPAVTMRVYAHATAETRDAAVRALDGLPW